MNESLAEGVFIKKGELNWGFIIILKVYPI
jgi:hypothetical protein